MKDLSCPNYRYNKISATLRLPVSAFLHSIPTSRRSVTRSFDLTCPVCRCGRVLPCLTNAANGYPGNHRSSSVACPYYFDVVLHSKSITPAILLCRTLSLKSAIRTENPIITAQPICRARNLPGLCQSLQSHRRLCPCPTHVLSGLDFGRRGRTSVLQHSNLKQTPSEVKAISYQADHHSA